MVGPTVSAINAQTPAQGPTNTGAQYTPIQPGERYQARYEPLQASQPTQQFQIPSLEQMGQFEQQLNQFQQPSNLAGLQDVFAQMMAGNMRMPQQAQRGLVDPIYQSQALKYRPDTSGLAADLSRVSPSVAEQQRRQAIEDAKIAAEKAAEDDGEEELDMSVPPAQALGMGHFWGVEERKLLRQ
jgi:hypothetical protein